MVRYWLDTTDESIVVVCGVRACAWRLLCWTEAVGVVAVLAHRATEHDYVPPRIGLNKAQSRNAGGCSDLGCDAPLYAKGMCRVAYNRARYKASRKLAGQTVPAKALSQRQRPLRESECGFSGTGDSPRLLSALFPSLFTQDKP